MGRAGVIAALAVLCALALAGGGASAGAASASHGRTFLPCVNNHGRFVSVEKPHRCTEYANNEFCSCTAIPLVHLHWRFWGRGKSKAKGSLHACSTGSCIT